ncbi:MAG: hypothetical protein DRJ05_13950 [Bacteroidetes bacterium]|nr:MAG: hypothetical protein DRJ05_13950 [Bacteroidota bacterium]
MRSFFIMVVLFMAGAQVYGQETILPDTTSSCRADSVLIIAESGYDGYIWSTGDTLGFIWAFSSGEYWVDTHIGDSLFYDDTTYLNIVDVSIVQSDTSFNCGDTIMLSIDPTFYECFWMPGDTVTDSIHVYPRIDTTYYAFFTDPMEPSNYCTDSIRIEITPIIILDTIIQTSMGCPEEDKAQLEMTVSGGFAPPYEYEWSKGTPLYSDPSKVTKVTDGPINYVVIDTIGCTLKGEYNVKAYTIPEVELIADPADTIYLQRPYIEFSYENPLYDSLGADTFQITTFTWDFGDGGTSHYSPVNHTYQDAGTFIVAVAYDTYYGCKGTDSLTIIVKPVKFKIPNVFTPDGNGINDLFIISYDSGGDGGNGEDPAYKFGESDDPININDFYNSNTLIILNRWGQKVFEANNYQNDWDGDGLTDGVYFYILDCKGEHEDKTYKGAVHIITAGGNQ